MAVNDLDGLVVGHTDMVGLDAHNRAQFLVHLVDGQVAITPPTYRQQPKV